MGKEKKVLLNLLGNVSTFIASALLNFSLRLMCCAALHTLVGGKFMQSNLDYNFGTRCLVKVNAFKWISIPPVLTLLPIS